MACAHNGRVSEAKELIDISFKAGADAVQLQFFVPEETVTPHHEAWSIINEIAFSKEQWKKIFQYAKTKNIEVWICTYDLSSVKWCKEFKADGIKLNSADLSNPDLLSSVSKLGIPFTLGTGASTIEEINNGLKYCESEGAKEIVLMHGVQNFPTKNEDLNISRVGLLKRMIPKYTVGYSDHTEGGDPFGLHVDLIALGCGAEVFEKHITMNRADKGVDYQAALEPEEFILYCKNIRRAAQAFGSGELKPFSKSDYKYRKFQKKSIVAKDEIPLGTIIQREHFYFARNIEPGIPPIEMNSIIGKTTIKKINKFDNIELSNLK